VRGRSSWSSRAAPAAARCLGGARRRLALLASWAAGAGRSLVAGLAGALASPSAFGLRRPPPARRVRPRSATQPALASRRVPARRPRPAQPSVATTQPPDRTKLGRYRIDRELGPRRDGRGLPRPRPADRPPGRDQDDGAEPEFDGAELTEARARFFREAETAGRLQHRDIVTIFDAGEDQDLAYIAMEYLKGHDLQRHTAPAELLPVPTVLRIVARVARRARLCAQPGRGAPRHQAGQRDDRPGRRP
jgi:serine/threonine-protein kinase